MKKVLLLLLLFGAGHLYTGQPKGDATGMVLYLNFNEDRNAWRNNASYNTYPTEVTGYSFWYDWVPFVSTAGINDRCIISTITANTTPVNLGNGAIQIASNPLLDRTSYAITVLIWSKVNTWTLPISSNPYGYQMYGTSSNGNRRYNCFVNWVPTRGTMATYFYNVAPDAPGANPDALQDWEATICTVTIPNDTKWHMIGWSYNRYASSPVANGGWADKKHLRYYIDGKYVMGFSTATPFRINCTAAAEAWTVGRGNATFNRLNGSFDNLMVFDKALTDGEVYAYYEDIIGRLNQSKRRGSKR